MKLSCITVLSLTASVGSVTAFAPSPSFTSNHESSTHLGMSSDASKKVSSRLQFLQTITASTILATTYASPANAAKYGPLGASPSNVIDPKTAVIDQDILNSDSAQNAIKSVQNYVAALKAIKEQLTKEGQTDIAPVIRKYFDFVQVRTDLNALNAAFEDEETQKGTDRIIRVILQDITELEVANRQKEGVPRSEKRLDIMCGKVDKLDKAFSDYLALVQ